MARLPKPPETMLAGSVSVSAQTAELMEVRYVFWG